ncbi:DUF1763-domain-containing protein [Aureobasidium namibiae CBS 147.97]|uniref:DUF1763-domain-containing protein n=1 Tax=Aureobasidium namibiae CBS 147.97 TaxID=1043004 RepID=A0A074XC25_9PEZI
MSQQIIHAYRHLLRTSLQAIRYAKPARYTLQSHLRSSFRNPTSSFSPQQISQTLQFLDNAAMYKGLEDKIVRNLLYVWGTRHKDVPGLLRRDKRAMRLRHDAYEKFDDQVKMLQRSLGIRLG